MRNGTRTILAVCCAALVNCWPAFGRDESSRDFKKSVALPSGRNLRIEHSLGNITVRSQPKNEVEIQATIKCSAETAELARTCVNEIKIAVEESAAGVLVRTEYPERRNQHNLSQTVRYDITIPETAPLEIRDRFGAVDVSNLHAPATINNGNGSVKLTGGRGRQRIDNSFGAVEVLNNDGEVTVVNGNGDVTASGITGALDITNRFGNVRIANVGRGLIVHNGNGTVEAAHVTGIANLSNSFGGVIVSDAKSDLTVQNQNGEIGATDIAGTADLHTSFGGVKFARIGKGLTVRGANSTIVGDTVGGSATVETSFGSIDLRGVKGGVRAMAGTSSIRLTGIGGEVYAKTSFGGVTVEDAGGPVTVDNQTGSVTVISKPGQRCQPVRLQTSFGPLRVTVPRDAGYDVIARTSFGHIHSEPEMVVSGMLTTDQISGKIGSGGCELRLMDQNGNIDILKGAR
jgi:hypothetical protein